MREFLSVFLITWTTCLVYHVEAQNAKTPISEISISDNFLGKRLFDVFNEWEQKYDLKIDALSKDIPNVMLSEKSYDEEPIENVLKSFLGSLGLDYRIQPNRTIIIRKKEEILAKFSHPTRFNFALKGKLVDEESGETLPFATVYIKSSNIGTTTNVDGFFTLLNTPSDTSIIMIQYIGYQTREIRLNPGMIQDDGMAVLTLKNTSTQLAEITISTQREYMIKSSGNISTISISPAQLSSLPNLGEKDIFRSLQMLPGISATNETSSGLYVRGGTPDQNLVLFDGFTVYHVDHFYGFFSAFNANAVKDVQLYKGGFGAKYGGRLSSVVDLTGKNGNTEEVSGNIGISAISINGSIELPFADGKGSFFLAGRRSYTDIIRSGLYKDIFDLFQDNNQGANQPLSGGGGPGGGGGFGGRFAQIENEPDFYFYDLNAKLSYRPSDKEIISFSFYNGQDKLDNSNDFNSNQFGVGFFGGGNTSNDAFNNSTIDLNNWGNIGSSLRWGRQWNSRIHSNTVLSYSKYFTNRDRYSVAEVTRQDSTFSTRTGTVEDNNVNDFTFRTDVEYLLNNHNTFGIGVQVTYNHINYNQVRNDTITILDRSDNGMVMATYLQDEWRPTESLTITPGVRVSQYSETNQIYTEPRISASYKLTSKIKVKAAYGKYYQFVTRVVREDFTQGSRDFWLLSNADLNPVSSAIHYIAGISYETEQFLFDVETYYKDMSGLSEYTLRFANNFQSRTTEVRELFYQGNGYARGVEFLVQKKFGNYTGWVAYTLSEVIHDFPDLAENPYHALNDQTHEFKVVNSFRLGSWTLAATWIYATGKPYTSPVGGYELTLLDGTTNSYVSVGEKNGFRLPNYHRMDVSCIYGWSWGNTQPELGLSVFNAYNRVNVWYKTFEIIDRDLITTNVNTIGFTPNIFFNIKF